MASVVFACCTPVRCIDLLSTEHGTMLLHTAVQSAPHDKAYCVTRINLANVKDWQQILCIMHAAGPPAKLSLQPLPAWFDATRTLALANHSTVPQFTLQLLDASDFCTTPFSQGDR